MRATGRGRVRVVGGRTLVSFSLSERDVFLFRRGLRVLGEMMLAAGAEEVGPGVHGWEPSLRDRAGLQRLEEKGPRSARAYTAAVSHMFGTCRMGSNPAANVVRPDFRHHTLDQLYVADSSVFPTNTGVNPQTSILALATLCGQKLVA